jgi:N-formylglutamate deformylase
MYQGAVMTAQTVAEETLSTDLIAAIEAGEMPPGGFRHRDHVALAWHYFEREPPLLAMQRFVEVLHRFVRRQGAEARYHETVTWSFLLAIIERRGRLGTPHRWADFVAASPDLLENGAGLLARYYYPHTLEGALARQVFVLPDRLGDAP